LLNAFGAWACGNLADGSSAHWNIRQVAAQLARADARVRWLEGERLKLDAIIKTANYLEHQQQFERVEAERERLGRRLDWIEDHATYKGGGSGGTYTFAVHLDSESMMEQVDHAIAALTRKEE
jgi:hypothetical protein